MTKRYVALILALVLSLTLLPVAIAETAETEKISYWADMNANMAQTISNLDENERCESHRGMGDALGLSCFHNSVYYSLKFEMIQILIRGLLDYTSMRNHYTILCHIEKSLDLQGSLSGANDLLQATAS